MGLLFCVCVPGILQDGGLAQNRWQYFLMVNTSHLKNIKIELLLSGPSRVSSRDLAEIQENHFDIKYCTFWEEHIFLSDHKDSPKVDFLNLT